MKTKIVMVLFIVGLFAPVIGVRAAPAQPPDLTDQTVLSASGSRFLAGWNFFILGIPGCSIQTIFDEIQAAGGASLKIEDIYVRDQNQWQRILVKNQDDTKTIVSADQVLAVEANLPFFLSIDQKICRGISEERKKQIETLRSGSETNSRSFLTQLASIPSDFWSGVLNTLGFTKKQEIPEATTGAKLETESAVIYNNLNVFGKTTLSDLGLTGKLTIGLLQLDDLDGSINSLKTLKFQNTLNGNVDFLSGLVVLDTSGNIFIDGKVMVSKSTGLAIIKTGQTIAVVENTLAKPESKIFTSPLANPQGSLYILEKGTGRFTVSIGKSLDYDLPFDWWVIN